MITQNLADKVQIIFEELDNIVGPNYTLTNTFTNKETLGTINNGVIQESLEDGVYCLVVYNESEEDFKSYISVYYNQLPLLIKQLKTILCGCSNCEKDDKNIYNSYVFTIDYLSSVGLLPTLKSFNYYSKLHNKIFTEKTLYKEYYGTFKFDNEKNIKDTLVGIYVELYLENCKIFGDSQSDLDKVNERFKIDIMENCLYKNNYDICKITNLIESLDCKNCNCNE